MEKPIFIQLFGILTDVVGSDHLEYSGIKSTDELLNKLYSDYPILAENKFRIAVNHRFIEINTDVIPGTAIALMPPFSGG